MSASLGRLAQVASPLASLGGPCFPARAATLDCDRAAPGQTLDAAGAEQLRRREIARTDGPREQRSDGHQHAVDGKPVAVARDEARRAHSAVLVADLAPDPRPLALALLLRGPLVAPRGGAAREYPQRPCGKQRPQPREAPQSRDSVARHWHVHLDVRDAGREIRGGDVAPGDRHREARAGPEVDPPRPRPERLRDDCAVPAHARTLLRPFDRRSRRARAHHGQPLESEREMRRIGERFGEARGQAIGGNHVEADARADDDAGRVRLVAPVFGRKEDVDFAGDVDVMRPRRDARVEHWCKRSRERPGAVGDDGDSVERAARRRRVGEPEHARRQAELRGERGDPRAAAREDRHETLAPRFACDELARVPGSAVDHPGATVSHARSRSGAFRCYNDHAKQGPRVRRSAAVQGLREPVAPRTLPVSRKRPISLAVPPSPPPAASSGARRS